MGRSRRRLIIRPLADRDIDDQFEYLAIEAGLDTANRFLLALQKACKNLLQNPELGSPRQFANKKLTGLRIWPVRGFRRHLIFYIPTAKTIEIVRILHGARDVENLILGG